MGVNDGGIKRGDRADTGDLEAQPKEGVGRAGSSLPPNRSSGNVTGASDALAETLDRGAIDDQDLVEQSSLDPLDARDPDDPTLGLTNIGDQPAEDWAANTGPSQSGAGSEDEEVMELPEEPEIRKPAGSEQPKAKRQRKKK